MQVQGEDKPYDDINITPMLDLAYVLLVIFILMTTATVAGTKVNLPKASTTPAPLSKPRTKAITINNEGKFFLDTVPVTLPELEQRLAAARENGACLISMGWGGGLLAKSAWLDTTNTDYRQILQQFVIYNRALSTNLPFPKTRRIVFLNDRPATLPGWAELAIEE